MAILQYRGLNCIQGNLTAAGFNALKAAIPAANVVIIPIVCTGTSATSTDVVLSFADSVYQGWVANAVKAGFQVILAMSFRLNDGTPPQNFAPSTLPNVQTWFNNFSVACAHVAQLGATTAGCIGMWCGIELQPYAPVAGDIGPFTKAHLAQWQAIYNACKAAWPAGIISYVASESSLGLVTPTSEWSAVWDFWDAVVFDINPDIASAITSASAMQTAFDTQVDANPNTQAVSGNISLFQALDNYARVLGRKVIINACGIAPATGNQVSPENVITAPPPYDYTMGTAWWTAILAEVTSHIQVLQGFFAYSGNTSGGTSTNYGDANHLDTYGVLGWAAAGLINTTYDTLSGESPDQTTVIAPSTAVITDATFNEWGISPGGQVTLNGIADTTTSNVIELAYVYNPVHTIWQENNSGFWFSKTNPASTWSTGTSVSPLTPVTPPPGTITESAQNATVTTVGPALYNAALEAWTISAAGTNGQQVVVNGVIDTTTSRVTLLLYNNHRVYQENADGNYYWKTVSTDTWTGPVGDPRVVVGGTAAPPQASGTDQHGNRYNYIVPVFAAEFDSPNDISSDQSGTVRAPFYSNPTDGFGGGLNPGQGSYSIANSILTINSDTNSHGDGLDSVQNSANATTSAAPTTIVAGSPVYGYTGSGLTPPAANGNGIAFRYGYFEARLRTNLNLGPGGWYPTFWMYPTRPTQNAGGFMELDVFELYPPTGNSLPYGMIIVHSGPDDGAAPQILQGSTTGGYPPQSAINRTAFNNYGVVWTPTFIQYWVNNVGGAVMAMDSPIAYNKGGSLVGNSVMNLNQMFMVLIIGTGPNWPVDYEYVRGYQ